MEGLGFASPALSASLNLPHHMQDADADWQEAQRLGLSPGGDTYFRYYDEPLHVPPKYDRDSPELT